MERRQIVSRLGTGTRILIVRPYWRRGDPDRPVRVRLQVMRRWGWRTLAAGRMPGVDATEHNARIWLLDYEQRPDDPFRRFPT